MSILEQSFDIAKSLLPITRQVRKNSSRRYYHFAFGYRRSRLLAIGQNDPDKTHPMSIELARRFGLQTQFPYLHAETDLVSKLWGEYHIDKSMKVVVLRLDTKGQLRESKPCSQCGHILKSLGISKLWWSVENGFSVQSQEY